VLLNKLLPHWQEIILKSQMNAAAGFWETAFIVASPVAYCPTTLDSWGLSATTIRLQCEKPWSDLQAQNKTWRHTQRAAFTEVDMEAAHVSVCASILKLLNDEDLIKSKPPFLSTYLLCHACFGHRSHLILARPASSRIVTSVSLWRRKNWMMCNKNAQLRDKNQL